MAKVSQKKKNEKKKKVLLLLVLLLGITVGFATLSQTLNINGTSKIKGNSWDLSPDDTDPITCPQGEVCTINPQTETPPRDPDDLTPDDGVATQENPNPTGSVIWMDGDNVYFKHLLSVPGDTFTFNYTLTNNGTVDAKVSGVTVGPLNGDATNIAKDFIDYSATYDDGTAVAVGDTLAAQASVTFKVTVTYKSSVQTLPTAEQLAIINGQDGNGATSVFTVNYEQA